VEYRLFIDGVFINIEYGGGKNAVIGRQLIVSNDLEVFAFIESVINGTTFAQERDHRPLGLVQHIPVMGLRVCVECLIYAYQSFLFQVIVSVGFYTDDVFDVVQLLGIRIL